MKKVLILSSEAGLNHTVKEIIFETKRNILVKEFSNVENALTFLHYELPDILILNFADENIDMYQAYKKVIADLWLNNAGIIALHQSGNEDEFLASIDQSNLLEVLSTRQVKQRLPGIIKILDRNDHLIFQRDIPKDFWGAIQGKFILDNNPYDVSVYANLISLYLFNANLISLENKGILKNALVEMLMNAIEHGNCEIGFEEKSSALAEGKTIFDLVAEKNQDKKIAERKVVLSFKTQKDYSTFSILDQGDGFDWRSKKSELVMNNSGHSLMHGRGMLMTSEGVQNLRYNNKGNEATFDIRHQNQRSNLRPRIFQDKPEHRYNEGDLVFKKGEGSNFLAYIVSGSFNILDDNGVQYARLTPNDIFIGEMAFLLGNERTATVQANTDGTLIQLTKEEFVDNIRQYPYYGLFLARLLAQRMEKLNQDIFSSEKRNVEDFLNEAKQKFKGGHRRDATNLLRLANTIFANDYRILYLLGKYLSVTGKFNDAIAFISESLQIKPSNVHAYIIKAYCFYKKNQLELARAEIQRALDISPGNPDALYNLVKIYVAQNETEKARHHFEELKQATGDNAGLARLEKLLAG